MAVLFVVRCFENRQSNFFRSSRPRRPKGAAKGRGWGGAGRVAQLLVCAASVIVRAVLVSLASDLERHPAAFCRASLSAAAHRTPSILFLSPPSAPDEFRTGAAAVCRCCRRTCRQRWRRRQRQQQRSRTAAIASEPRQPRLHRRIRRAAEPASVERRGRRRRIDPLRFCVRCAATKSHIAQPLNHIQTHSQTGAARSDSDATDLATTDGCEGKRGEEERRGEESNG